MSTFAMMHGDGDYMMSGWIGSWIALWAVLALALIVLAVVATVWLVKHLSSSGSGSDDRLSQRACGSAGSGPLRGARC